MASRRRSGAAVVAAEGSGWLTRKLVDDLVDAVDKKHLPKRFAALYCGVSPQTFETALQEGASGAGGPLAVELARRVFKAIARDVGARMRDLDRLAKDDPRASTAYLQTKYPEDFGGHVRTAPDEFAVPERQKKTRGMLLDHPPPRMLAEFRAHGWVRIPADATPEDRAAILAIIDRYEQAPLRAAQAAILTTGEPEPAPGEGGPSD